MRREARKMKITEEVVEVPPCANLTHPEAAEKTAVTAAPQQKSTTLAFQCEECDYKSTSEKGLKQHARMKHRLSQVASDKPFRCEAPGPLCCDKTFSSEEDLNNHVLNAHYSLICYNCDGEFWDQQPKACPACSVVWPPQQF